jgi:protein-tyrosine phosphatase
VHDSSVAVIEDQFEKSYKFIKKAMEANTTNRVLVHCSQGVSRSATIVIYFLMREKRMKMKEARKAVEDCRPWIWPNEGFVRQLGRAEPAALNGKAAGKKPNCVIQ